jgi:hypothetical protein
MRAEFMVKHKTGRRERMPPNEAVRKQRVNNAILDPDLARSKFTCLDPLNTDTVGAAHKKAYVAMLLHIINPNWDLLCRTSQEATPPHYKYCI